MRQRPACDPTSSAIVLVIRLTLIVTLTLVAQPVTAYEVPAAPLTFTWQACLGGDSDDVGQAICPTPNGQWMVAGYANSRDHDMTNHHDGDVSAYWGRGDFLVARYDNTGKKVWSKCFGGTGTERALAIAAVGNDTYWVAGYTDSNEGDVSGNHGGNDAWVIKVSGSGSLLARKCLGGGNSEIACGVQATGDGGCIVVGTTDSPDGDVKGLIGQNDAWVVKLDSALNIQWQKCLGTKGDDLACAVDNAAGGYVVGGRIARGPGNQPAPWCLGNGMVAKLAASGATEWLVDLGGMDDDTVLAVHPNAAGGFICAGYNRSPSTAGHQGGSDAWVFALDANGGKVWEKSLGGSADDTATSIRQLNDGGYIMTGETASFNGDVGGVHTDRPDLWLVRLGAAGDIHWQRCLGGRDPDVGNDLWPTSDGGYVVTGGASPRGEGDIKSGHAGFDLWIFKAWPM